MQNYTRGITLQREGTESSTSVTSTLLEHTEVIKFLTELLDKLDIGMYYEIKLNHRKLLDAREQSNLGGHPVCATIGADYIHT